MIKHPVSNGEAVSVTFELPASVQATTAAICGDFNQWSPTTHPLVRDADGQLRATVDLPAGRAWRFRYILDGERWENDWAPDAYVPNEFGGDDSVVDLTVVDTSTKRTAVSTQTAGAAKARTARARTAEQATPKSDKPVTEGKTTARKARKEVSPAKPAQGNKSGSSPRSAPKQ
jgi:1,4-alpha-glucan branching enzyme